MRELSARRPLFGESIDRGQLWGLALSPLLVFFFVVSFSPALSAKTPGEIAGWGYQASLLFLLYSFLTSGHITAVFYRGFGIAEIRKRTGKKSIIGSLLIFSAILFTDVGFFWGAAAMIFWIHYHYVRQHFGVLRMLSPKSVLSSRLQRNLDTIFCFSVYFLPIFYGDPALNFDPKYISDIFVRAGMVPFIYPLLSLLQFLVNFAQHLFPVMLMLWVAYMGFLLYRCGKDKGFFLSTLFSFSLLVAMVVGWLYLDPLIAVANSVLLHSVQYYFIVGKDQYAHASPKSRYLWIVLPILTGILFGAVFTFMTPVFYLANPKPLFHVLAGLGVAANIVHFWMDAYVWKRPAVRH